MSVIPNSELRIPNSEFYSCLYDWAGFAALKRYDRHPSDGGLREFHVSRGVREACGLDASLFTSTGNVVFADFRAAREFAHRLNEHRPAERAISASDIYALGLIDEVLHLVVARHRRENAPNLWADALDLLGKEIGRAPLAEMLRSFVEEFPPTPVFAGEVTSEEHLSGETGGGDHRHLALEELVMLWLANRNPAFEPEDLAPQQVHYPNFDGARCA